MKKILLFCLTIFISSLLFAQEVIIKIYIPKNAANIKSYTNTGKAKHEIDKSSIYWRLKKLFGEKDFCIIIKSLLFKLASSLLKNEKFFPSFI